MNKENTRKPRTGMLPGLASLTAIMLLSCAEAEIHFRPEPEQLGFVSIYPDRSEHALPAMRYYFYSIDDGVEPLYSDCDGVGNFEGQLPAGTYRVLAVNAVAGGIEFRGMDSHHTATAYDTYLNGYAAAPTRTRAVTGSQPVYTTVMQTLEVNAGDTLYHTPAPVLLTHTVTFTFTVSGDFEGEVSNFNGALYGVYPSIRLFDGTTSEDDLVQCPNVYADFVAARANAESDLVWQVNMNLFGIHNPRYGDVYTSVMHLNVTIGQKQYTFDIDITQSITEILEYNLGVIPLEIPLEIEIALVENTLTGIVKPWKPDGSGTGEMPLEN